MPLTRLNTMKTSLECFPCFLRQALDAIRQVSQDRALHERLLKQVCREASEMDLAMSPVEMGRRIQRLVRQITGSADPYRAIKRRFNDHALRLRDDLRRQVERAQDPFELAVRLAIAGNRIDFGASGGTTEREVSRILSQADRCDVNGSIQALRSAVESAGRILYLADNTGEIVLDRLLIERLPMHKVTVAVRGGVVINDATLEDAITAGLPDLVEVIDNGSDAPGTVLADCSSSFRDRFDQADLIIAKGQGNYETLNDLPDKQIFFLLMVKCSIVAAELSLPLGSFVVHCNRLRAGMVPR